jgi:hypothetical protein
MYVYLKWICTRNDIKGYNGADGKCTGVPDGYQRISKMENHRRSQCDIHGYKMSIIDRYGYLDGYKHEKCTDMTGGYLCI